MQLDEMTDRKLEILKTILISCAVTCWMQLQQLCNCCIGLQWEFPCNRVYAIFAWNASFRSLCE